jgi:adenylate cyclase
LSPFNRHLLLGLLTGLATLVLSLLPVAQLLELKGYDLFHALRRPLHPPAEIVLVAIDEPSFAEIGKQWPWPRSLHGRLVGTLKEEGASVVGFDILFAEPSLAEEDRAFAAATRDAANVVLASDIEILGDRKYAAEMTVEPADIFRNSGFTGIATVPLDPDGVVRGYQPLQQGETAFSERIAQIHSGKELRSPKDACLSYLGPPGSFTTVSYYQALDPSQHLPENFFRGKIVLVGRAVKTAPELGKAGPDMFATPFLFSQRSRLMAGVEIHANMILGLLEGRFVQKLARWEAALLLLALGLLGSLVQVRWKPFRSGLLACAILGGYWVCACGLFSGRGLWIPTLLPVLSFSVPYGAMAFHAYFQSERKRREIRKAFSHYLSPSILKAVLKNPEDLKLGGERVEVTILFSDLAGFTTLAEKLSPEGVHLFLNRYFTEMTSIIFAHRGTIDKFIGDAIMAFWGAPVADAEHAVHACRAAVAMQERMKSLREEMKVEGLPELFVRIGINTGQAIVGNMGSSELFNYTVLGDAVNLASRLEGANKEFGTSILISGFVYEKAAASVRARPLGRIAVKGKTVEVEALELVGIAAEEEADHGGGRLTGA